MKKQVLLLTLFACATLATAIGNPKISTYTYNVESTQSDEIDLRGRIEPAEIRRDAKAISAFLQENEIKAQFHFDIGTVQVAVMDQNGNNVYTVTVVSTVGEIAIPIIAMVPGNYTITFTASAGVLSGNFNI